jgi:hypothetical protein
MTKGSARRRPALSTRAHSSAAERAFHIAEVARNSCRYVLPPLETVFCIAKTRDYLIEK